MTARSTRPEAIARSAKRVDTTPKVKRVVRGTNTGRGVTQARVGKNTADYAVAETIDPNKPLTDKQKAFVRLWAEGESIMSASVRAGYSDGGNMGYRLTKMPNVLVMYHDIKTKYEEAGQMTRQKVMDMMLESYDMARMLSEPASMVAAAREIGKICGYYAPVETRIKLDVSGNIVHQKLNSMTDAELLEVIARGAPLALAMAEEVQ